MILLYLAGKVAQESGLSKGACMHSSTEDFFYLLVEEMKTNYFPQNNIAPENQSLEDEIPFGKPIFRGYVSFTECT